MNLHILLYSHFTQNSVVKVNRQINKEKNDIWQIIVRKLQKKKVFLGRGAYSNAVAQRPLVILIFHACISE